MKFALAVLAGFAQADYSYYTGDASTWYSSSLDSDAYPSRGVGGTSYDYTYRNSYSYSNGQVYKWDYARESWNTSVPVYNGESSTWFSPTLVDDGPGYTSYDYTYMNSYSYGNGQVYKWDYSINGGMGGWNFTDSSLAATPYQYSYYTGADSTWVSSTLDSDHSPSRAIGGTSYDYTYRNSYSYSSSTGNVYKWDYALNSWNYTLPVYDGGDSTWFSSTLQRDSYSDYTSYDWTYMNSYSYDTSTNDVLKWDYAYNNWNFTSTQMGGFLVGGPYKPEIHGETLLSMVLKPTGVKPSTVESPVMLGMLVTALFSVMGMMAYKYKAIRAKKALNNSAFERQSEAVDNVLVA